MYISLENIVEQQTPFYYYDMRLLNTTIRHINNLLRGYKRNFVHYAIKANSNPTILRTISSYGLGADCVSGGEIKIAIENGFLPERIVFAGVGKSDAEICYALEQGIAYFNVESQEELQIISEIAHNNGKIANVALRINPNVDAHTHSNITTGLNENKFGINIENLSEILCFLCDNTNIHLKGLHFHIGSQIIDMKCYIELCHKINEIKCYFTEKNIVLEHINVGGGLGIDYDDPLQNPLSDFESYFEIFNKYVCRENSEELHFELGRSVVGQCGALVSEVLYIKDTHSKKFMILDAGMTELLRPALYNAHHKIINLSQNSGSEEYDVVGPVCESSDCFGKSIKLPRSSRGNKIAILSAGAYGEVMSLSYNCRHINQPKFFY